MTFSLVLLAGCSGGGDSQTVATTEAASIEATTTPDDKAIVIRTTPLARASLSEIYGTTATLRADKKAMVTSRTQGVLQRLHVEEGDRVSKGQSLAELENDEQRIEYERAEATAATRKREFERSASLHSQGLVADEVYEATRRMHEEARHTADLAELALSRTIIRAPFSGQILTRLVDLGATLSNGTELYELADLSPLYADFGVPERHIGRLLVGQAVRLATEALEIESEAKIERIAPLVDTESGTVKVTAAVHGDSRLRPGTFVRVGVVTDTHADAFVVPRSALVSEGRRWHLFRVREDGTHVERLEIVRGFEEGPRIEVSLVGSETTLSDGDRIVTVGASALSDGSSVTDEATANAASTGTASDAS
jgi:membrane fusion protein (multidrug efflux system)